MFVWFDHEKFVPSSLYLKKAIKDYSIFFNNKSKVPPRTDIIYIGLRYDYAEKYYVHLEKLVKVYDSIKLVYCMRYDIEKLHISQRFNPYQRDIYDFEQRISSSYNNAVALKKNTGLKDLGFDIFAVDITENKEDFKKLDKFLDLEPSRMQLDWAKINIKTNERNNKEKLERVRKIPYDKALLSDVSKELKKQYIDTKKILQIY